MISFFGVYDGHGGSTCSEWLRKNLHVEVAKRLFKNNTHAAMKDNLITCFDEVEEESCTRFAPGSCCTTVMIKDNFVYCADCGDSMAVIYGPDRKMIKLNDRHGVEFSQQEIQRLRKAKAEVSTDYETEGAVISRDSRGRFIKALYPTRGFGDADFKDLVKPKPVVIATPTGVGVGYEGPAFELKGPGPYWLLVGCDGLWDFMKEDQITKTMFSKDTPQAMAEHLVKVAQGHPYSSYDDVTCIVVKIELN
jgi:serine/threonine protein phosphatase PrpC